MNNGNISVDNSQQQPGVGVGQSALVPIVPRTWDRKIAKVVSTVANPAILSLSAIVLVANVVASASGWLWAGIGSGISILLPMGFIYFLLRHGKITDFDVFFRKQRSLPYIFTISCGAVTIIAMWLGNAPVLLLGLSAAGFTQTLVMYFINKKWKISAHAAGMAGFITTIFFVGGNSAIPFLAGIPLIVWSRVRLKRHTFLQTLAGTGLGVLIFVAFLWWITD